VSDLNWNNVHNADPKFCPRRVSDGFYRAPHYSQCRKPKEAGGKICRFHRLLDERAARKGDAYAAREKEQDRIEKEAKELARRLRARFGITGARAHYNGVGKFRDCGYTRDLVISFEQVKLLVEMPS